jgi:hypothetical protein
MNARPDISPGAVIQVAGAECVVFRVREVGHPFGDCEVVCNKEKPANVDVVWRDGAWAFTNPNDLGGYAERNRELWPFIRILRGEV